MKLLKEDLLVEARYVNKDNPSEVIETNDEGALTKVPDGTIIGKKYANVAGDTYFHKIDGDRLFVYKLNDEGQLEKETPKEFVEEGTYQREKEEVERKATEEKNNKERAANLLNNIIELEKKKGENAWFEVLVPHDGPAKSVAGEWIRAIEKIRYRYYNDGDYFYTGYGLETSGPAASYLSNIDDEINDALVTIAEEQLEDDEYEKEDVTSKVYYGASNTIVVLKNGYEIKVIYNVYNPRKNRKDEKESANIISLTDGKFTKDDFEKIIASLELMDIDIELKESFITELTTYINVHTSDFNTLTNTLENVSYQELKEIFAKSNLTEFVEKLIENMSETFSISTSDLLGKKEEKGLSRKINK